MSARASTRASTRAASGSGSSVQRERVRELAATFGGGCGWAVYKKRTGAGRLRCPSDLHIFHWPPPAPNHKRNGRKPQKQAQPQPLLQLHPPTTDEPYQPHEAVCAGPWPEE
jgi:hypothetical protein